MKCEKCANTAVVHMTDLVTGKDGVKRAVEMHLCAGHATDFGVTAAQPKQPVGNVEIISADTAVVNPSEASSPRQEETKAIVPAVKMPAGLTVVRKEPGAIRVVEALASPACGITWHDFKHGGKMGCPHDYIFFAARLEGVVKRAQENSTEHVGKVPTKMRDSGHGRTVTAARLRRELEQALRNERFEEAAGLRDQLRQLG